MYLIYIIIILNLFCLIKSRVRSEHELKFVISPERAFARIMTLSLICVKCLIGLDRFNLNNDLNGEMLSRPKSFPDRFCSIISPFSMPNMTRFLFIKSSLRSSRLKISPQCSEL